MNLTRNGLIVGIIIGIVLGGGIGTYTLYSKISALESEIEELEDQLSDQQDLTEFQQEVFYYDLRGINIEYYYVEFNGTTGIVELETWLFHPEMYPHWNITIIEVSKKELREIVMGYYYEKMGVHRPPIYANLKSETIYFWLGEPQQRLEIFLWSP